MKAYLKVALSSELKAVWWWARRYPCPQTSGKPLLPLEKGQEGSLEQVQS